MDKNSLSAKPDDNPSTSINVGKSLQNSFKVKRHKFYSQTTIRHIDASQWRDKNMFESFELYKIIHLEKLTTIEDFLEIARDKKFCEAFNKSSNCFVIIAEVFKEGMSSMIDVMNCFASENYLNRPLIIQLKVERSETAKIFYKECRVNEVNLVELPEVSLTNDETFGGSLSLELFLRLLKSNIGGEFTGGDLLSCEINLSDVHKTKSFINWAADSDNSLLIRFLKLIIIEEIGKLTIDNAIKSSSPDTLAALLDFPINTDDCFSKALDHDQIKRFTILAVGRDEIEMLQFLLRLVFTVDRQHLSRIYFNLFDQIRDRTNNFLIKHFYSGLYQKVTNGG